MSEDALHKATVAEIIRLKELGYKGGNIAEITRSGMIVQFRASFISRLMVDNATTKTLH